MPANSPSKNSIRFYAYLVPVELIFSSIFDQHVTPEVIFIAIPLSFFLYRAFFVIGKKYDQAYSFFYEINVVGSPKLQWRRPWWKRLAALRRYKLMFGFYISIAVFNYLSALFRNRDMIEVSVIFGFTILFYIIIDQLANTLRRA